VFGIRKPCLLLPEGIADRLTPPQLEAILAHELRHVERRDNLTAAIHMLVETIFWFHPCVWWIRARLMEERERACDEEVVRMGTEPQVYAESILKVCEFYLTSPAPCAGVTGGELKKRIAGIMAKRIFHKLNLAQKALLAAATIGAVGGPIAVGLAGAPRAQSQAQAVAAVPQAPGAGAQAAASLPSFEVASVKPASPKGSIIGLHTYPGGRITATQYTLFLLILDAFDIEGFQVAGAPGWATEDRYDIEAMPPASSQSSKANPPYPKAPPNEEQRQMLQSLIADRFQLRFHREKRDGPVYLLVRGKNELKLQEPKNKGAYPWAGSNAGGAINGDGLAGANITMSELAARLSDRLRRPVLDQTGLKGSYDFKYQYLDPFEEERPDVIYTILKSVQEIGLKLDPGRGPVETIVIDHVEKPSAN
jgi:uncharacterized protein (TIGR03435 family)